jgi:ATP-dependent helicase/DNAse subunit B
MKEIWLGPLLGNNRARLIQRCAELVASHQSNRFVYLTASQPLLEIVTQGILDGARNPGLWGELPVYLFRGFVRRLLTTAVDHQGQPFPPRVPIDRAELPLKRSLISQILKRALKADQLKAIAPVANREGCVNSIANLIGEIQRAARTPAELNAIIAAREQDSTPAAQPNEPTVQQIDFDKEVALIYTTYSELLDKHGFTEDDADQLRALQLLDGSSLADVQLLVLDGFFDFTPVQGEILRSLIPRIPEVIVNLNHDERNPDIFRPFQDTISHLKGIADFAEKYSDEHIEAQGALASLRETLFNSTQTETARAEVEQTEIRYFECGDRETEIRTIAKEIKQLVLTENVALADIGLVVRERDSYAETIARVMHDESLPCTLQARIDFRDVPGIRATLKLLAILEQSALEEDFEPRIADLADLVKSEFFRLGKADLDELADQFMQEHGDLLPDADRKRYRIGFWDADALENTFAYVGSDLHVQPWLARAKKLVTELPGATETKQLLNIDSGEPDRDPDVADQIENAETAKPDEANVERKRRPSRDIHPAQIAWTALVIHRFAERIRALPQQGKPTDLRVALMGLLDHLSFSDQITRSLRKLTEDHELPQLMLNFNSLEALRRAFVAAIKSIEVVTGQGEETSLAVFVEEVRRSLNAQSQLFGTTERGGLRVLEATDVRGLRFRALFIAGLVEGGFPLRATRDWIYPHEERERLKSYGLTLEDISPATLLKEEHYFYQSACRATERLYLTRPLMLEDDTETVASYYIDELRHAIAPLTLDPEVVRRDYDGKQLPRVSSNEELSVALVRQQERHLHPGQKTELLPQPRIKRLLTLARNDGLLTDSALRRIEIERERAALAFGPYDGQITDPHLLKLIAERFGPEFVHSASGLSVYGNCAYRFFAQRVLKLEPRGEAALDLQAIDAGKLLHDILRRFFERHRREPLDNLDFEALRSELKEIADTVFDEHERVVPPLNKQIWKIDREIRKILLDQVLRYELEIQRAAASEGVLPAYFEVAFGGMRATFKDPQSTPEPLQLTRSTFVGDERLKISGQIDRVDVARDKTFIAYDYKLSSGSSKEDIKSGRSLQIPIYLEALEKLILPNQPVAGGGYYVIRGSNDRRNKGLHRAGMLNYSGIAARAGASLSDEEWTEIRANAVNQIWEFLDRMRAGRFEVNPSEKEKTCKFCDFTAVCRYNRYRIERKKQG